MIGIRTLEVDQHTPHRYEYNGDWVCAKCGSAENLVIHHADFNHSNNDPNNLQCLCVSCHSKLHIETRARNARGQMIKEENYYA